METLNLQNMMLQGVTICREFHDYLALTLPRNLGWFRRWVIVTSPDDQRTPEVVERYKEIASDQYGCELSLLVTDAFFQEKARFNKGAGIEAGFDHLGRQGWFLHLDADIVLPSPDRRLLVHKDFLHGARRRMLEDSSMYSKLDTVKWSSLPLYGLDVDSQWGDLKPGYFQLFHSSSRNLKRSKTWYPTDSPNAAKSDMDFQKKFPLHYQRWFSFEVLHLGERDTHWSGRATPFLDGTEPPNLKDNIAAHAKYRNRKV